MATVDALKSGDRRALARAITLVESTRAADEEAASRLLEALGPVEPARWRLGISGAPGVGKSTFIEAFGPRGAEAGPEDRGADRRSLVATERRLHPRRQDQDGTARAQRLGLHPLVALARRARRRGAAHPGRHPPRRGGGLRSRDGGDRGRRAVGGGGRLHDGHVRPRAGAWRRRQPPGGQARHHGTRRPRRRQQGRRRPRRHRPPHGCGLPFRPRPDAAAGGLLDLPGRTVLLALRRGSGRGVGGRGGLVPRRLGPSRGAPPPPGLGRAARGGADPHHGAADGREGDATPRPRTSRRRWRPGGCRSGPRRGGSWTAAEGVDRITPPM